MTKLVRGALGARSRASPPASWPEVPIVAVVDTPTDGRLVAGRVTISGWAWAKRGISRVEIDVNGRRVANAVYGIEREDVAAYYDSEEFLRTGFFAELELEGLPAGLPAQRVGVRIVDETGLCALIERTFVPSGAATDDASRPPAPEGLARRRRRLEAGLPPPPLTVAILDAAESPEATVAALESVSAQTWPASRTIVAHGDPAHAALIHARGGAPILAEEGPAAILGAALAAGGDDGWIVLLPSTSQLRADALLEIATVLAADPDADIVTFDHDSLDAGGRPCGRSAKPAWSPTLLRETPYVGSALAVRAALAGRPARPTAASVEEAVDLWLVGLAEHIGRGLHVRAPLAHTEIARTGLLEHSEARMRRRVAAMTSLTRLGHDAEWESGLPGSEPRLSPRFAVEPRVSLVAGPAEPGEALTPLLRSLVRRSTLRPHEILVLERSPLSREDQDTVRALGARRCLVIPWKTTGAALSLAAREATGDVVVFVSPEVRAIDADWLAQLVHLLRDPGVGLAGTVEIGPDDAVASAGIAVLSTELVPILAGRSPEWMHAWSVLRAAREVTAVAPGAFAIRRDVLEEAGGFDARFATRLTVIELSLRLGTRGRRSVVSPRARVALQAVVPNSHVRDAAIDEALLQEIHAERLGTSDPYLAGGLAPVRPATPPRSKVARGRVP